MWTKQDQIGLDRSVSPSLIPIQGPRESIGRPTGSMGVKGWAYRVQGSQEVCLQGASVSRGRPAEPQGVKG